MIKLDQSSGTCNLETNICTYPNTEILENNSSEAPDLSNAVPKNELVRVYINYNSEYLVNVNGNNKYLYPTILHPNNDDSITLNTIEIADPFLRFDTKIYIDGSILRSSLNPEQWNHKITNDASITFDKYTPNSYYGNCPQKVIDGITYSCDILKYLN